MALGRQVDDHEKKNRILVVEDKDRDFDLFSLVYQDRFDIVRARTQEEALSILQEEGGDSFSGIVLDLLLPDGGDPSDVIQSMHQYWEKVTILSGSEDPKAIKKAQETDLPFFTKKQAYSTQEGNDTQSFVDSLDRDRDRDRDRLDRIEESDAWQTDAIRNQVSEMSHLCRDYMESKVDLSQKITELEKEVFSLRQEAESGKQISEYVKGEVGELSQQVKDIKKNYDAIAKWGFILRRIYSMPKWLWLFLVGGLGTLVADDFARFGDAIAKFLENLNN